MVCKKFRTSRRAISFFGFGPKNEVSKFKLKTTYESEYRIRAVLGNSSCNFLRLSAKNVPVNLPKDLGNAGGVHVEMNFITELLNIIN
jgi:hypothetical protein